MQSETNRNLHRFRVDPANFQNSEAYFRVLMLITVLQQDLDVHYNLDRVDKPDFTNSKDLFIHGMLGSSNGGTCVSMPVLYVAVGRRLGYPLKLVVTKGHVFARWDGAGERFNIDGAGRGLHTDDDVFYTTWPYDLTEAEINSSWFLRSLTSPEELAVFLMQRGHCLEDTGRIDEAKAAYEAAHRLAPRSPEALAYLTELDRRRSVLGRPSHREPKGGQIEQRSTQEWIQEKRRNAENIARQATKHRSGHQAPNFSSVAPAARGGRRNN